MPVAYELLPEESIIICTFTGDFKTEDLRQMYRTCDELLNKTYSHLYRISNFSAVDSTFPEVMAAIKEIGSDLPGGASDPRVTTCVVGSNQWTRMAVDFLKRPQFGGLQISLFQTIEDALAAMRLVIHEKQRLNDE